MLWSNPSLTGLGLNVVILIVNSLIQILLELQLHYSYKPVDLLAHIRVSTGDVVVLNSAEVKHGSSVLSPALPRPLR